MWKFIVKRLIMLIPVLIGVTLLVFLILQLAPGDPAKVILGEQATTEQIEELRESLGLNDPVLVQYANYIIKLVQGDASFWTRENAYLFWFVRLRTITAAPPGCGRNLLAIIKRKTIITVSE